MEKKYISKGVIIGPISTTLLLFCLFFIGLLGLYIGFKLNNVILIYISIAELIAVTILANQINRQSYKLLTILDNGLEYKIVFWSLFKFYEKNITVSWDEIKDVVWLSKEGGMFKVLTQLEEFTFFVSNVNDNIDAFSTIKNSIQKRK